MVVMTTRAEADGPAASRWPADLCTLGFAALASHDVARLVPPASTAAFRGFWDALEPDGELPGGASYRLRRYGRLRAEITAEGVEFTALPHAAFRQDASHIPDYGGRERVFSPIPAEVMLDPAITGLVALDLSVVTRHRPAAAWIAGLHMVRVVADSASPGRPTPEGRHRDGHDYIGMHLVSRRSCSGGVSIIYRPGEPPVELTLAAPLDSVIVDDGAITHEVTPIAAAGGGGGVRDTLLVDLNIAHAGR
jgi:hypothetical protein